jgi:hypothetical protein
MKTVTFITLMLLSATVFANDPKSNHPVRVLSARMSVVYFKVDKDFIGASVEVYSEKGELILSQDVTHRKALIDFYYETPGIYTIKIKKGDREEVFNYIKGDPAPVAPVLASEAISLTQL